MRFWGTEYVVCRASEPSICEMGTVSDPRNLPELWRKQANAYKQDGVPSAPAVLRRVADELERVLAERELEELTVQQDGEIVDEVLGAVM